MSVAIYTWYCHIGSYLAHGLHIKTDRLSSFAFEVVLDIFCLLKCIILYATITHKRWKCFQIEESKSWSGSKEGSLL